MSKLIVANWKMNGSLVQNQSLLRTYVTQLSALTCAIVICPPFPYLAQVQTALAGSPIAWGAQNMSEHEVGAHTGEVSALMLQDFACRYVIIGHSERRQLYGESDRSIAAKVLLALRCGLRPILCVGETLAEREAGKTQQLIAQQLQAVIEGVGHSSMAQIVIAYEPVWAIGSGNPATAEQVQEVHAYIRGFVAQSAPDSAQQLSILYGGSVRPNNAAELFALPDVAGALVGGASLMANDFLAICQAAR